MVIKMQKKEKNFKKINESYIKKIEDLFYGVREDAETIEQLEDIYKEYYSIKQEIKNKYTEEEQKIINCELDPSKKGLVFLWETKHGDMTGRKIKVERYKLEKFIDPKCAVHFHEELKRWWKKRPTKKQKRFEDAVNYYQKRINLLFDKLDKAKTLEELEKVREERNRTYDEIEEKYNKRESEKIRIALRSVPLSFFNSYESRRATITGKPIRFHIYSR